MDNVYLQLYCIMFKIGITTFGGGLAMVPIMTREFVETKKWISEEEIIDIIAISESLPGSISINICIVMGYKLKGFLGGVCATLGVVTPCILIITIVTYLYNSIDPASKIWLFIRGVRAGVVGILCSVVIKLFTSSVKDKFTFCLFICGFVAAILTDLHIAFFVVGGGFVGYIYSIIKKKMEDKTENNNESI